MKILIVDDNEMLRRGIRRLVESEVAFQVVGEARDGREAIQKARELRPDLILLDISMPQMNGLDAARIVRHDLPEAKILILSQHDPIQLLPRAIAAGADGCVDKSRLDEDLLLTIKAPQNLLPNSTRVSPGAESL